MGNSRHKEIMAHADVQFAPQRVALQESHDKELRQAQSRARQTNNAAAMLPAEAASYIAHVKALVTARAESIADAYTAFNEPTGQEAEAELLTFFAATVAARKSSFQAQVQLREMRTRASTGQLVGVLGGFERDANPALSEGRAILNKQRIALTNKLRTVVPKTKYVVDTCVFNWLADGRIHKEALPSDGGFAITHIQVDEINKTKDEERRAGLLLMQTSLRCELLPTQTFVFDISRFDYAMLGDGRVFTSLKAELDRLNGNKESNIRDALIAEAAIANKYTLLTADRDLRSVTEGHGGMVIFFPKPSERGTELAHSEGAPS